MDCAVLKSIFTNGHNNTNEARWRPRQLLKHIVMPSPRDTGTDTDTGIEKDKNRDKETQIESRSQDAHTERQRHTEATEMRHAPE